MYYLLLAKCTHRVSEMVCIVSRKTLARGVYPSVALRKVAQIGKDMAYLPSCIACFG